MITSSIVLKSFNTIVGDTFALGLNVLSEEYVNLLFKTLYSFKDPIEFDLAFTIKSDPKTEFVDSKLVKTCIQIQKIRPLVNLLVQMQMQMLLNILMCHIL